MTHHDAVQYGPSLESSSYLNVTLRYLGPYDSDTFGPMELGTLGPYNPWTFGLLDLSPPPPPPHTLVWFGLVGGF